LRYHVVSGQFLSGQLTDGETLTTLNGKNVTVSLDPTRINDAGVTIADLMASNGVVHAIDKVLIPPAYTDSIVNIASGNDFSTLVTALNDGNLVDALSGAGPFTLFAPTDAAFSALPAGTLSGLLEADFKAQLVSILKYHVLPSALYSQDVLAKDPGPISTLNGETLVVSRDGATVKVNNASVTRADLTASNGVVQGIDQVLLPPSASTTVDETLTQTFSTLAKALRSVGLQEILAGKGPYTVFAPTNDAFNMLPKAEFDKLFEVDNQPVLLTLLQHHVVKGNVVLGDLAEGSHIFPTLAGDNVTIVVTGSSSSRRARTVIVGCLPINQDNQDNVVSNGVVTSLAGILVPGTGPGTGTNCGPVDAKEGSDDSLYWLLLLLLLPVIAGAVMLCMRRKRGPPETHDIEAPVAVSTPDPYPVVAVDPVYPVVESVYPVVEPTTSYQVGNYPVEYVDMVSRPHPTPTGSLV